MKTQQIEKKNIKQFIFMLIAIVVMTTACKKDKLIDPIDDNPGVELSSDKAITSFVFLQSKNIVLSNNVVGQINETEKAITMVVPAATDISGFAADVETSSASSYSPASVQSFINPVEFTITAEDGSAVKYMVTVTVEKTEREVLQAILDVNPSNTLEWDLSQTINLGDLEGVELNVHGKIRALRLRNKSITNIPTEIGFLVELQVLDLARNSLSTVFTEIGKLVNLKVLDISSNRLTSIPSEIGKLVILEKLYLARNLIKSLPVEIGKLTKLKKLFLFNNSLTSIPAEIGLVTQLTSISLRNNKLKSLPPEIGFLNKLNYLSITFNNLANVPFSIFNLARFSNLVLEGADGLRSITTDKDVLIAMNLGSNLNWGVDNYKGVTIDKDNRVTEIVGQKKNIRLIPEVIGTLTELRILNLDNNGIEKLPRSMGDIKGLEVIGLSSNQLKTVPSQFGKLKNAVLMNLTNNPIESIPSAVCDLQVSNGGKLTILADPGERCD